MDEFYNDYYTAMGKTFPHKSNAHAKRIKVSFAFIRLTNLLEGNIVKLYNYARVRK